MRAQTRLVNEDFHCVYLILLEAERLQVTSETRAHAFPNADDGCDTREESHLTSTHTHTHLAIINRVRWHRIIIMMETYIARINVLCASHTTSVYYIMGREISSRRGDLSMICFSRGVSLYTRRVHLCFGYRIAARRRRRRAFDDPHATRILGVIARATARTESRISDVNIDEI